MKIVLVSNSLTHYYNRVLEKLSSDPEIELVVVVPKNGSQSVGAGVFQESCAVNFKIVEVSESLLLGRIPRLVGLADTIYLEQPDIVIFVVEYMLLLAMDFRLRSVIQKINCKIIIKSIPFKIEAFDKRIKSLVDGNSLVNPWCWIRLAKVYLDRYIFRFADAHLNYIDASEMWSSYGVSAERVFVTGNSPDTDHLLDISMKLGDMRSTVAYNHFRIVHVGRLVQWKRVDLLLQAFQSLKPQFPLAELVIIGDGPELDSLKLMAASMGIASDVDFRGAVYDPHQLGVILKSCSVYVLAGMGGLSINDAMCFGLPIICSVCDGTETVLVEDGINGAYFAEGDSNDLVEKISRFFCDPQMAMRMGENSVEIIRNRVNIRKVLDGYKKAFRFVVDSNVQ